MDLDETLVHTFARDQRLASWLGLFTCVPKVVLLDKGLIAHVFVGLRPYLLEFLDEVTALFQVVVYTSAERDYAEPIIELIGGGRLRERYYRSSCRMLNGVRLKDVRCTGRPISSVCIVDNDPSGYLLQEANAIPISSWTGDPFDCELIKLLPLLRQLAASDDVRAVLQPLGLVRFS